MTQFGPYTLDTLIGQGGMGQVYKAFKMRSNQAVALKILPPASDIQSDYELQRALFLRECSIVASLGNAHVVPVYDYGEWEGQLYLEMALLEGADLGGLLSAQRRLLVGRAIQILEQVANALDGAHSAGLLHRDIKPSNIFLHRADSPAEHVYLVDFGIARRIHSPRSSRLTNTGEVRGTLAYIAPEVWIGEHFDHRADIYSLACVLYESLAGLRPFQGGDAFQYMRAHVLSEPPPLVEVAPEVPETLSRIVARGLAKDPRFRFDTAGGFMDAVALSAMTTGVAEKPQGPPRVTVTSPRINQIDSLRAERPIWISRHQDGSAQVWDIETQRSVGKEFRPKPRSAELMAVTELDGRSVVISAGVERSAQNPVWIWDPTTGEPLGTPFLGHTAEVIAIMPVRWHGQEAVLSVATGFPSSEVLVWNLRDRSILDRPKTLNTLSKTIGMVAGTMYDGRDALVISRSRDEGTPYPGNEMPVLELRDLYRQAILHRFHTGIVRKVKRIRHARIGEADVVVCEGHLSEWEIFDVATGRQIVASSGVLGDSKSEHWRECVSVARGQVVVIQHTIGGLGGGYSWSPQVRVLDYLSGQLVGPPFVGLDTPAWKVALTDTEGGTLACAIYGRRDSTDVPIKTWDVRTGEILGDIVIDERHVIGMHGAAVLL